MAQGPREQAQSTIVAKRWLNEISMFDEEGLNKQRNHPRVI
jgi:hypothetical protein